MGVQVPLGAPSFSVGVMVTQEVRESDGWVGIKRPGVGFDSQRCINNIVSLTSINITMRFEARIEPFEHIIIHDVFTPEELKNVWTEIEFLHPRLMRVGENGFDGGSAQDKYGNFLKQNSVLALQDIYNYQSNVSYILQYMIALYNREDLAKLAIHDLGYYFRLYLKAATHYFKLQYYEDNDGYKSHTDETVFSASLFLHKDPKNFTGGDFVFDEYDYTISCDTNKMIMFPSTVKHSVTPVIMLDDTPMTGRYSITTFKNIK